MTMRKEWGRETGAHPGGPRLVGRQGLLAVCILIAMTWVGASGKPGPSDATKPGGSPPPREVTAQDFSVWFGSYLLPPPGSLTASILEGVPEGKAKQDAVKRVYDDFGKDYQVAAREYFARLRDLQTSFQKKPLAEADAKKAVNGAAEAQKKMLKAAEGFWGRLRTTLGAELFKKWLAELSRRGGDRALVPLPSLAVLISPLPQDLAFILGQYLEIQPAQLERFKKQSSEKEIETAAASFIQETGKLLQSFVKAGAGDWSEFFRKAENQVDAEASLALLEVKMWRAFNDALSADQARDHWVIFYWEKQRAFFLSALLSPPPLATP
jgi:hypothetical protein